MKLKQATYLLVYNPRNREWTCVAVVNRREYTADGDRAEEALHATLEQVERDQGAEEGRKRG